MIRVHYLLPTLNTQVYTVRDIFAEGITRARLQLMFWRIRRRRDFYCYEIIKRRSLMVWQRAIEISRAFSILHNATVRAKLRSALDMCARVHCPEYFRFVVVR